MLKVKHKDVCVRMCVCRDGGVGGGNHPGCKGKQGIFLVIMMGDNVCVWCVAGWNLSAESSAYRLSLIHI